MTTIVIKIFCFFIFLPLTGIGQVTGWYQSKSGEYWGGSWIHFTKDRFIYIIEAHLGDKLEEPGSYVLKHDTLILNTNYQPAKTNSDSTRLLIGWRPFFTNSMFIKKLDTLIAISQDEPPTFVRQTKKIPK